MESINVWGVLIGLAIVYLFLVVRWVPKPYNGIIEINLPIGGMKTISYVWQPGIHFLWFPVKPFMYIRERVNMAHKVIQLNLGMTTGFGTPNRIDFLDGVDAGLEVQITYVVIDPIKAIYNVQEHTVVVERPDQSGIREFQGYEVATLNRVEAELRSFFGNKNFEEANKDATRNEIEDSILEKMREFIEEHWGLKILDVDLMDFDLNEEIVKNRQRILTADITAKALKREAEGQKDAIITVAEGHSQADALKGVGKQKLLKAIQETGLSPELSAAFAIAQTANEAFQSANTTIIATSEGGGLNFPATMAGLFKGMMGGGNSTPPSPPAAPNPPSPTPPAPISPTSSAPAPASVEPPDHSPRPQDEQKGFRPRRRGKTDNKEIS